MRWVTVGEGEVKKWTGLRSSPQFQKHLHWLPALSQSRGLNQTKPQIKSFRFFSSQQHTQQKPKKKKREREREGVVVWLPFTNTLFKSQFWSCPQIKFQEKIESLVTDLRSILQSQTEPQVCNEIKSWQETISSPSQCTHSYQQTYLQVDGEE